MLSIMDFIKRLSYQNLMLILHLTVISFLSDVTDNNSELGIKNGKVRIAFARVHSLLRFLFSYPFLRVSTGIPGKIQVSEATAALLIAAGKAGWLTPRPDAVEAKGKGTLNTFLVSPV
jgi:hypothetical protein